MNTYIHTHSCTVENELHGFGIRLNKKPPQIYFRRRNNGGLNFQALVSHMRMCACLCLCIHT